LEAMHHSRIRHHMMTMPSDTCFLITFFDSCPGSLHVGTTGGRNLFFHTISFLFCSNLKLVGIGWRRKWMGKG